jgi:adenosylcobinamide-phosphate synthase
MGRAISALEPFFRRLHVGTVLSGGLFAFTLILSAWGSSYLLLQMAGLLHPLLQTLLEIVLLYYCISARSLEDSAMEVSQALKAGNIREAKQKVSMIVGRDVESLSDAGIARASVETVAENLVDGFVAPLFYAAWGGAPLAIAYKMINTLDSMIGYRDETYEQFGKAAARIDDAANFIPARVSIPVISLAAQILSGTGPDAFKTALKEGRNHSSPNAGYPEAAFAGALGVKLGGPNYYRGRLVFKPFIGDLLGSVQQNHIRKACDLMMLSTLLWSLLVWGVILSGTNT